MTTVLPRPRDLASSDALRELYDEHYTALIRYAQWFTADAAAAEDAVQETFLRAWRHLPRLLADGRPLRPWLRQVLRHIMIDVDRTARAQRETLHDSPPVEGEVDGGFESLLDRTLLAAALRELSPAHREVLVDIYYCDAPAERVAARLGVPTGTVRSRLHYALRAVRSRLDALAGASGSV
jgi:RNA polymerase sigma-70 factor, ECF subfamily